MFISNDAHRSPLQALFSLRDGESVWRSVEISLAKPWFLVSITESEVQKSDTRPEGLVGESMSCHRTVLIASLEDLISFVESLDREKCTLDDVQVVVPPNASSTKQWMMDRLSAIWHKKEWLNDEGLVWGPGVLETASGSKYFDFPTNRFDGQDTELVIRIRFSQETEAPTT